MRAAVGVYDGGERAVQRAGLPRAGQQRQDAPLRARPRAAGRALRARVARHPRHGRRGRLRAIRGQYSSVGRAAAMKWWQTLGQVHLDLARCSKTKGNP